MRFTFEVYDDNYKVTGIEFNSKIKSEIIKSNRNYIIVSKDITPIDLLVDILNSEDISIDFNFVDFNDFIGSDLLKKLFKIAYSNKEYSHDAIENIRKELSERNRKISTNYDYTYPDIILEDKYFLECLDQIEKEFANSKIRVKLNISYYYETINDKNGNRDTLRNLCKLLFIINYSTSVSKNFTSFVLSKFNLEDKKQYTNNNFNKTIEDYLNKIEIENFIKKIKKKSESPKILLTPKEKLYLSLKSKNKKLNSELKDLNESIEEKLAELLS